VLRELPYDRRREYDPEDTVRYYALRLHEVDLTKSTPNKIIAQGTNWRFLDEYPIAQIAPNGNRKSPETGPEAPFFCEIDCFPYIVLPGASTLTRFFTDD
jgi:hypothetical protein